MTVAKQRSGSNIRCLKGVALVVELIVPYTLVEAEPGSASSGHRASTPVSTNALAPFHLGSDAYLVVNVVEARGVEALSEKILSVIINALQNRVTSQHAQNTPEFRDPDAATI